MVTNIVLGLVALALLVYLVYVLLQRGPVLMGDTVSGLLTIAVLVAALAIVHVPLGNWMAKVFTDEKHWRVERLVYRLVRRGPRPRSSGGPATPSPSSPSPSSGSCCCSSILGSRACCRSLAAPR